jgi:hypothetical protein
MKLAILGGGAAQGLVQALSQRFKAETGCDIVGTFGAVGAMRDKLIGGTPASAPARNVRPRQGGSRICWRVMMLETLVNAPASRRWASGPVSRLFR